MSPPIAPPSPETVAELLSVHANRFPSKATVDVPDDDGEPIPLPLLVGTPSGATTPAPDRVMPAWADLVALTMGAKRPNEAGIADTLARDCLIYPTPAVLGQWEERWPAVLGPIGSVVMVKLGMDADLVKRAPKGSGPGAYLLDGVPVTITAPTRAHYVALKTEARREGADHVALLAELVAICVKGTGVGEMVTKRPGLALPLYRTIMRLAGEVADVRMGEW